MVRRPVTFLASLTLLCLGACGSDTTTSSTSTSTSSSSSTTSTAVTAVVTPDPAQAIPSTDPNYKWQTSFTVALTETAGVATTVKSLTANLQQAAGGIIITPPSGITETFRQDVNVLTTNRIDAKGNIAIAFVFYYTLPNGGRESLVTVTFNLTDDNSNSSTVTAQVRAF